MTDVTDIFQQYRQAVREMWNRYFWWHEDMRCWDTVDRFKRMIPTLFETLVLQRLGLTSCSYVPADLEAHQFMVIPSVQPGSEKRQLASLRVLESHDVRQVLSDLSGDGLVMRFKEIFESGDINYWDSNYFLVEIIECKTNPDVVGKDALVECDQVDVFLDEEASEALGGTCC